VTIEACDILVPNELKNAEHLGLTWIWLLPCNALGSEVMPQ